LDAKIHIFLFDKVIPEPITGKTSTLRSLSCDAPGKPGNDSSRLSQDYLMDSLPSW